jgi:hypothetical protein
MPILFADDTSLLVTSSTHEDLCANTNTAFHSINDWFKVNQLSINFNKTHYIQFTARNNNLENKINTAYDNKQIISISNIKFLGVYTDDKMSWKYHIEHINSKLSTACFIIRSLKPYTSINTSKMV